ncbi:MAG: MFS transporter [Clostridiales bacterium]|jgi:Na+/melibiose symporter-like transporter|nr:MFS transporter [Clostridiales bacterium]
MKLNYKQTIFVGLAFFSIQAFWQFYYSYMPLTATLIFGLGDLPRGFLMSIDNIVALVMLPLFGAISDRHKDKGSGRRTPYILIGSLMSVLFFAAMGVFEHVQLESLTAQNIIVDLSTVEESAKEAVAAANQLAALEFMKGDPSVFVGFVTMLVFALVSMGIYRTPAVALMPDVTPKPLLSQANAVINIVGGAGGLLATVIFTVMVKDYESKLMAYGAVAVIMIISIILYYVFVNEPQLVKKRYATEKEHGFKDEVSFDGKVGLTPAEKKSFIFLIASIALWFLGYYSINSSFTIYANQILGIQDGKAGIYYIVATLISAVAFIPIAYFSAKVGRKKTILGGIVILAVALFSGLTVTANTTWLMFIIFPLVGIGWASICVNSFPMIAAIAPNSKVGRYTGFYYAASMSAQGLAPIVSGFFMQTIDKRILFPIGALFVALSFVTMLFVRHGDVVIIKGKKKRA